MPRRIENVLHSGEGWARGLRTKPCSRSRKTDGKLEGRLGDCAKGMTICVQL